jgi:hypothetical protein
MMLEERDINRIVQQVASATLSSTETLPAVADVESASTIDSQGDPALKITIILTAGSTESIQGKDILKTLDQVQQRLQEEGEKRFPIVEFETTGEAPVGD